MKEIRNKERKNKKDAMKEIKKERKEVQFL